MDALSPEFWPLVFVGFLAQLIDGAMGWPTAYPQARFSRRWGIHLRSSVRQSTLLKS